MDAAKTAEEQRRKQFERMTTAPVPGLVVSLSIPTIISMMVTSIYNMADTYFVSQLGTSAAGAVGIVFSIMAIIQAVGFTLGMGAGNLVSRSLGAQQQERANRIAASGFFSSLACGLLLTVGGLVFLDPLMRGMGATETILPYARDYARYILLGAPVMCGSFVLNNLLRSQGKAAMSMVGIGLGGILNMVLDPIFIFVFHLGIAGAAIATILSQCISFLILLSWFVVGRSDASVHWRWLSRKGGDYLLIVKTGFPSFCRQGLASLATVALNVNAKVYGDAAVAAMSIVGRIFMFVLSVMLGFGQGFQPVVAYNYGAARYNRVREAIRFSLVVGTVVLTGLAAVGYLLAPQAMALFRAEDLEVIAIGAFAFRAQCLATPLQPTIVLTNMTLQGTGQSWQASLLSACRQGIFFLPLIVILPQLLGLTGVQITQTVSDLLTFVLSVPFMMWFWRILRDKEGEAGGSL